MVSSERALKNLEEIATVPPHIGSTALNQSCYYHITELQKLELEPEIQKISWDKTKWGAGK